MEERYRESFAKLAGAPDGGEWELSSLSEAQGRLTLVMKGGQELRWRDPVAYRVIDEGARLRQHALVEAAGAALVYEVAESVFVDELGRLSETALAEQSLRHFVVWTRDQCVDVVAAAAPEIS